MTDRRGLPAASPENSVADLLNKIARAASAGVDWIQIREKDMSANQLAALTQEALQAVQWHKLEPVDASNPDPNQQATSRVHQWHRLQPVEASPPDSKQKVSRRAVARTQVIVNDRLDVAIAERASGVHLGETSVPPADARRLIQSAQQKGLLAQDFLVGVSCHSLESAKSAQAAGTDYIFFGPIFATPSKSQYGEPQGLNRLAEVCRAITIPVLAIGGITSDNATSCLESGAHGIAAIRLFQDLPDLASFTQSL